MNQTLPPETSVWKKKYFLKMPRFLSRAFQWKILRLVVASFLTLVILFYTIENWRGGRALKKFRAEMEAAGEKPGIEQFIPKAVPENQNFGSIPIFNRVF